MCVCGGGVVSERSPRDVIWSSSLLGVTSEKSFPHILRGQTWSLWGGLVFLTTASFCRLVLSLCYICSLTQWRNREQRGFMVRVSVWWITLRQETTPAVLNRDECRLALPVLIFLARGHATDWSADTDLSFPTMHQSCLVSGCGEDILSSTIVLRFLLVFVAAPWLSVWA